MNALSLLIAGLLVSIAGLHLTWGLGATWPARTEADLIRTVVGDPRLRRMPGRGPTLAVAACLCMAAAAAILLRWPGAIPRSLVGVAGFAFALVFTGRAIAGYVPAWRRAHPVEPFAQLDRIVYSPLCFIFGLGFGVLAAASESPA